ncbi:MAG: hypothetical protein WD468_09845 [Pirellulales bacterium]
MFVDVRLLCCIVVMLLPVSARADEATDDQLAAKAQRLQAIVEQKLLQQHGMIPMLVRASDYQLPTAEDYKGAHRHRHLRVKTEAEVGIPPMYVWRAWENTSANTGYYLHAMSYQYRVTGDPKVLAICRRTLAALKYIYMLGVEKGERGFLCKPYGGVYSNQTSPDQVQCVVWGLVAYRDIAPPEDVADIDMMTKDFARHWIETKYICLHGSFYQTYEDLRRERVGKPRNWRHASIYLPLLYMAWYGSGDDKFVEEIERWHERCAAFKTFRVATDKFSTGGYGAKIDLYLPTQLMEMDPSRHELWRDSMLSNYRQSRTGLLPDGTWPTRWSYDKKKGGMTPKEMPEVGGGYGRTGRSALFAMGCVAAQPWFPKQDMKSDARRILVNLDEDTFRFIMPLDDEHPLPPEWQVESKMLDTDCLTGWLCAYWQGRYRGYW